MINPTEIRQKLTLMTSAVKAAKADCAEVNANGSRNNPAAYSNELSPVVGYLYDTVLEMLDQLEKASDRLQTQAQEREE